MKNERKPDRWEKEESRILLRDIVYVIIVFWISVFVAESTFLKPESTPFDRIFGYILVFVPLGTLNFFLHYLYRNRRIRRTGKLRSSLRYRLIIAFFIVSIIPSMPIFLLTSGRVESIISVLFGLDFRGGMESAERMMGEWEKQASVLLFERVRLMRPAVLAAFPDRQGVRYPPELFDGLLRDSDDAAVLASADEHRVVYGKIGRLDAESSHVHGSSGDDNFGVTSVDDRRYAFVSLARGRPGSRLLILKRLYPHQVADESKYRKVYQLLTVEESRWEKVIPYSLRLSLAILYLGMIVADLIIAILLARQISHPIVSLAAATRAVTEGHLDTRIDLRSEGEIGILIESFNSMTDELQSLRSRLLHSLRVGAWQEVARRLAHEIKNPLTPIQLSSERMLRKLGKGDARAMEDVVRTGANTIIEQVNVLKHLLEEFSNFARLPAPRLELQQIGPLIQESIELFRNIPDVKIELRVAESLPDIWIDKTLFIGMMNNLVKNGIEAASERVSERGEGEGRLLVQAVMHRQTGRRFVLLTVEDNGAGVPEELRESIFEPYFSTKGEHGNGLGLALVERAVLEHNARIYVSRSSMGGAEFRILFPEGGSS